MPKLLSLKELRPQVGLPLHNHIEEEAGAEATIMAFPPLNVTFHWRCFNCGSLMKVDRETFSLLEMRKLTGLKCHTCLTPPDSGLVAA